MGQKMCFCGICWASSDFVVRAQDRLSAALTKKTLAPKKPVTTVYGKTRPKLVYRAPK